MLEAENACGVLKGVAGSVHITPPLDWRLPLFGYESRVRPAGGVSSELFANVLVVSDEMGRIVVFMTFDTLYVGQRLSKRLSSFAKERYGVQEKDFLCAASHTHFAPALDDSKPCLGRADARYLNWVADRCEKLLTDLLGQTAAPLLVRSAAVAWDGAVFRRRHWPLPYFCGHKKIAWGQPVMAPNPRGPSEGRLRLWTLQKSDDEKMLAAIWTCACHPTGGTQNLLISADFCSHARQRLFEVIGAETPVLFFQGFAGDQRPNVPERRSLAERIGKAMLFGPSFATFDAASWRAWTDRLESAVGAAYAHAIAHSATPAIGKIETALFELPQSAIIDDAQRDIKSVITFRHISLGNLIELFGVSAEASTQLRELIPFPNAIPIGYIGDVFGYWPTEQQRQEGGYEGRRFFRAFGLKGRFRADLDEKFRSAARQLNQEC